MPAALGLGVEALEHLAHELAGRHVLHLVEDEALAAHHPAPAHVEDLHRRLQLVAGDADDVEVLGLLGDHRLLLDGLADAGQPVAQAGRPLELQGVGRLPHLPLEPADDGLGVAVEEVDQLAATSRSYSSSSISPTHGPVHFSMWNSRHGRPRRSWWPNLLSQHVRIGNVRSSRSSVSRMA